VLAVCVDVVRNLRGAQLVRSASHLMILSAAEHAKGIVSVITDEAPPVTFSAALGLQERLIRRSLLQQLLLELSFRDHALRDEEVRYGICHRAS
jgi:hypothetical protein